MTALRNVVKASPQLVFRFYTEAEHLSASRSTPPRDVIDKLDLRVGRRYRYKVHWRGAARPLQVYRHSPDDKVFEGDRELGLVALAV